MNSLARKFEKEGFADHNANNFPVNEESRRIRLESLAGSLILEEGQVITYHGGGLMIAYRRSDGIYTEQQGGKLIAPEPYAATPSVITELED